MSESNISLRRFSLSLYDCIIHYYILRISFLPIIQFSYSPSIHSLLVNIIIPSYSPHPSFQSHPHRISSHHTLTTYPSHLKSPPILPYHCTHPSYHLIVPSHHTTSFTLTYHPPSIPSYHNLTRCPPFLRLQPTSHITISSYPHNIPSYPTITYYSHIIPSRINLSHTPPILPSSLTLLA